MVGTDYWGGMKPWREHAGRQEHREKEMSKGRKKKKKEEKLRERSEQ